MKKILAFDIGGTSIKSALFDETGQLLKKWSFDTPVGDHEEAIFEAIASEIDKQNISKDDILGIGVGTPGPVKGTTVYGAVNLGWDTLNVKVHLEKALGYKVPVFLGNDANIAALGEYSKRPENIASMLFVTLGTGVGGGIVLDGKMHEGANGSAAEIGHMQMINDGILCNCGLSGCLETLTSATAVTRLMKEALHRGEESSIKDIEYVNAKTVFDHAKNGDDVALSVVDYVAKMLGKGLARINAVIDVPLILIGGGLSNAGEYLLEKVRTHYDTYAFKGVKDTEIKLAELGNDAGIYGALYRVMQNG